MIKGTSVFLKKFRVYHVYFNFILGYMCRINVIFGILKDLSLLIDHVNIFASDNCFSYKNIFQKRSKWRRCFVKIIDDTFLTKSWKFYIVRIDEHLSLEAYKYEETNIYVLTIMQHKEEVKFYLQKYKFIDIASVEKIWPIKENGVVRRYPHCRR